MNLVELTSFLIKGLLPDCNNMEIKQVDNESDIIIQVLVPEEKMSIVIGKAGKIANSIRTVVQAVAYTNKLGRVRINIDSL